HCRRESIAAALLLDQVRDDFGVGLGDETVAGGFQLALELEVVLDDAAVHDDHAVLAVAVPMRVLFRGPAVRRPARMADAEVALNGVLRQHVLEVRELARAPPNLELPVTHERDARRVVAAILEAA